MHYLRSYTAFALGISIPQALGVCPYAACAGLSARNPHVSADDTTHHASRGERGVFYMNRIGPGSSELYIANADGSNERPLLSDPVFEYHADFSPDGEWITFTSERNGDGNSDIYRVRVDGSDLQELVATPSVEDGVVLSPDGKLAAFVSTANGYKANIWVLDIKTGRQWNLTDTRATAADPSLPNGYFRPSWSPDGQWLAFSSDRNSGWYGHGDPAFLGVSGWEHTQELSIYAIRPNGSDFRQIATKEGYSLGSPKWSPDGKRIIYYEMPREATWDAHRPESVASANSTIVSVDFQTRSDRQVEVDGAGIKIFPQYISSTEVAYFLTGGAREGIYTTGGTYINTTGATIRSPAWSPNSKTVVYEKTGWNIRPMAKKLYSFDSDWDYRFTDVFPQVSNQTTLAITQQQLGDSSIVAMSPNGTNPHTVFDGSEAGPLEGALVSHGLPGAFQPAWSPDGTWIAVGVGFWFQTRATGGGWLVKAAANGSHYEVLTESAAELPTTNSSVVNSGFPSVSPDGNTIIYRVWGANSLSGDRAQLGLRLMDLRTRKITVLTNEWDNLPFFSPDGKKIAFTRKTSETNYDVCTIRPDGTGLRVLTSSGANDAHAVWSHDGRIMYSTGMFGFQYECALYDDTFQPYGQIVIMDADGSNKQVLTDSIWEDSMPLFVPNSDLDS